MNRFLLIALLLLGGGTAANAVDLTKCRIVYSTADAPLVKKMANVLSEDIERVSAIRPNVTEQSGIHEIPSAVGMSGESGGTIVLATVEHSGRHQELRGTWERYAIDTEGDALYITGSDPRGLAYGVLHVSEAIGVSPWYWWADVPVKATSVGKTLPYRENVVSKSPSVKYRGFFINDEDWGLKTWSARNFERDLKDIGPKTYDRVCELILRLKGNMLAPAMHSCTGAFYSPPESQQRAAEWGIMITTSHCEPMLFNNAAKSEWDKERDGEWNYLTNKQTIWQKFDDRLRETAQYDNIYTMGMRGLHDAAMSGSKDPKVRARTLEQVMADQREILERHKGKAATDIPQIFVPYKETLGIYDAGLRVPDDITLIWPDDNYGYMKRVSNETERQRSGGSGVYYHLSYLGTPHDNLWIHTTAPMLMYEELRKAYDSGADRYWLLNVGDIKPLELGVQQFFAMAYDLAAFNYDNVNRYQARWLADIFGKKYEQQFQQILDTYYRLAWQRRPEFMGYEMEWDSEENNRLHDTDFAFADSPSAGTWGKGSAEQRLFDYQRISEQCAQIERALPEALRPAFFEILSYSVQSAYQMNRKFLMAQRNHETGSNDAAQEATTANDSIQALLRRYNTMLDGKWNQMISQVPPGLRAKYQLMPELSDKPTSDYRLPSEQLHPVLANRIDLSRLKPREPFRRLEGIGMDWFSLQMGQPFDPVQDPASQASDHIDIVVATKTTKATENVGDTLRGVVSVVPFWPIYQNRGNRFGLSVDGGKPVVCENSFTEWSGPWKLQVLENRKDFTLSFPIDRTKKQHTLTLIMGDPGQIIQSITYQ